MKSKISACVFVVSLASCSILPATAQTPAETVRAALLGAPTLPELCAQYDADRGALRRLYAYPFSSERDARMAELAADWLARLDAAPFETLSRAEQIDWLLLRGEVLHDLETLDAERSKERESAALTAFTPPLVALLEARSARALPSAEDNRALA